MPARRPSASARLMKSVMSGPGVIVRKRDAAAKARMVGRSGTKLDRFDAWYERNDRDIARMVASLRRLVEGAEGEEAFERLEVALASSAPG